MKVLSSIRLLFASLFIASAALITFVATTMGAVLAGSFWTGIGILAVVFAGNAYWFEKIFSAADRTTLARNSVFGLITQFAVFWLSLLYVAGLLGFVSTNFNGYLESLGFWIWTLLFGSAVIFSCVSINLTSTLLIEEQKDSALSMLMDTVNELNNTLAQHNFEDMRRIRDFMKFRIDRSAALNDEVSGRLLCAVEECKHLASADKPVAEIEIELGKLYAELTRHLGST